MKLDDVLKVVGSSTLDAFPWGSSVVMLVNSFLPDDQQLTGKSTGEQLSLSIGGLPVEQQQAILTAKINPLKAVADLNAPVPAVDAPTGLLIGKDGKLSPTALIALSTALIALFMAFDPTAATKFLMSIDWEKLEATVTHISGIIKVIMGDSAT